LPQPDDDVDVEALNKLIESLKGEPKPSGKAKKPEDEKCED
jgi:hypothetical protein